MANEETRMSAVEVEFPKKLNKQSFSKLRREYGKATGGDLCEVLGQAKTEAMNEIRDLPKDKVGDKLRTVLFKLVDYDYALGFCKRRKE